MEAIAKVFMSGNSQAIRLPKAFRVMGDEVTIRQNPETGEIILSPRPTSWDGFFAARAAGSIPRDFISEAERNQGAASRDPFGNL